MCAPAFPSPAIGERFRLTDEPLNEPPALLNQALANQGLGKNDFQALQPAETITVETVHAKPSPKTI
jgi:hypothetical protein